MTDKKHDSQVPRPQPDEKASREGALQEGLHLAPNQPPQNSVLPPTNTGGGSTGGQGGSTGGGGEGGEGGDKEG
jgi:hypothetical protein